MYHLIIKHGWRGREKDICIASSTDLTTLKEHYLMAESMAQNPRVYETELMPPSLDRLDSEVLVDNPGF